MPAKAWVPGGALPCIDRFRGHGPLLQGHGPLLQGHGPLLQAHGPLRRRPPPGAHHPWALRAFAGTIAAFRTTPRPMTDSHDTAARPPKPSGAAGIA